MRKNDLKTRSDKKNILNKGGLFCAKIKTMTMIIKEKQFDDELHEIIFVDVSSNIREKLNLDTFL